MLGSKTISVGSKTTNTRSKTTKTRSKIYAFVWLLALLQVLLTGAAFSQNETETELEKAARELREALGGRKGQNVPEEVKRAHRQWAFYKQRIDREVSHQNQLLTKGGQALWDGVKEYAERADGGGDAVDHYLSGRLYGRVDDLPRARDHFDQSVKLDPWFYWGYHGLGTYFAVRKMWEPAVSHYVEALRLNPEYMPSLRGLAMCQARSGDLAAAAKSLKKILTADPDDLDATLAMARLLADQLRYEEAADYLGKALELSPKHLEALYLQGRCLERSDRADLALASYEKLVGFDPKNWRAFLAMARIFHSRGEMHRSADMQDKVLAVLPPEGSGIDPTQLEASIAKLRDGPAVQKAPGGNRKSAEDWAYIMLNSAELERRQKAARVLVNSPRNTKNLNKAFLTVLAKDKDPQMRAIALSWIRQWWPKSELKSKRLMDVFRTLLRLSKDEKVIAQLAWLMEISESPAAVPALVSKLPRISSAHAFREMHRALNKLTYAYIELEIPWDLGFEDMNRIKGIWSKWYEENRGDYRRYEEK